MTEPSEEYIRGIKGVKILINEDLNDDEIMVSPRVYEKMKSELKGKPVGYSPKHDEDFQKMLDELGEVNENYPAFDLTPPTLRCIPERTGTLKISYNQSPPIDIVNGRWINEIIEELRRLGYPDEYINNELGHLVNWRI